MTDFRGVLCVLSFNRKKKKKQRPLWRLSVMQAVKLGGAHLSDALLGLLHIVVGSSCAVDHPPHLRVHGVSLEGVHCLGAHLVVHRRVQHRAVRKLSLLGQVLEGPWRRKGHARFSWWHWFACGKCSWEGLSLHFNGFYGHLQFICKTLAYGEVESRLRRYFLDVFFLTLWEQLDTITKWPHSCRSCCLP